MNAHPKTAGVEKRKKKIIKHNGFFKVHSTLLINYRYNML